MAKRWYTSDLHLWHERIIELCNRPFDSVEHMDAEILRRWDQLVDDEDTVYILGDLAMGPIAFSLGLVAQLKGKKILIPGNHDRVWSGYKQSAAKGEQMRRMYEDAGLTIGPQEVTLENGWKLCHFPTSGDSHDEDRYVEYRPTVDNGQWLIHGHVHNQWRVKGKQINVGVDMWGFAPVPEATLELMISTIDLYEKQSDELRTTTIHPSNQFEMLSFS